MDRGERCVNRSQQIVFGNHNFGCANLGRVVNDLGGDDVLDVGMYGNNKRFG